MIIPDHAPLPPNLPAGVETLMLFDASQPSLQPRLTIIDLRGKSPTVLLKTQVAHGKGSDINNDGVIDQFSNTPHSNATSLGLYRVGDAYGGKHGTSYRLHGLDPTNSNAFVRAVVIHSADYVSRNHVGRSFGCPAVSKEVLALLTARGMQNTYLYIHQAPDLTAKGGGYATSGRASH